MERNTNMRRVNQALGRNVAAGVWALSAALLLPGAAAAADAAKTPTFTKDIAPIFREK